MSNNKNKAKKRPKVSVGKDNTLKVLVDNKTVDVKVFKKERTSKHFYLYIEVKDKFQIEFDTTNGSFRIYPMNSDGAHFTDYLEVNFYVRAMHTAGNYVRSNGYNTHKNSL